MQVAREGECMLNLTLTTKSDWFEVLMKIERTFSLAFLLMMRTFLESNKVKSKSALTKVKAEADAQLNETNYLRAEVKNFKNLFALSVGTPVMLRSFKPHLPSAVFVTF
jgi:hypothetical protein